MHSQVDAADAEQTFWARVATLAAQMTDWKAVMESTPRDQSLPAHVRRYILRLEAGPAVLYLLAKYPSAIPEIGSMQPDQAQMAIDQLVRDCTPYGPVDPAHLFDVKTAMLECIDRHHLFRWIPSGKPN